MPIKLSASNKTINCKSILHTMYFNSQDIDARRRRLETKWNDLLSADEAVLVYSGEPIQKPGGLDQNYPFMSHPAYFWLTGRRRESEVVFYSRNTGWVEFQKNIPVEEAIWENDRTDLLVNTAGKPTTELQAFLAANKFANVYSLGQSGVAVEGKAFDLRTALDHVRRRKDSAEMKLIRHLAQIANIGYQEIEKVLRPGISERAIQVAYEGKIIEQGAHGVPYDTIVGSGTNSAILHALPTQRIVQEGEFVLVDAGVDMFEYCVDITRVYPSTTQISSQHKDLYALVLKAHTECIAMAKPGVMWRDVHLHAARVMAEGLKNFGVLKGSVDMLVEQEAISAFFPHGVGHLVGLRVRDTGHEENINPKTYAGARLRVDIELEEDHFITVEPGCYFIAPLLAAPHVRSKHRDAIDWDEVSKWMHVGGVRIEDNILITANGNDNLTIDVKKLMEL